MQWKVKCQYRVSTSADQPKPKRLLHCCPYKTEPEQTVEAIDVFGPVEASKGVSSYPRVGLIQWQLF